MTEGPWSIRLDPPTLLPGRPVTAWIEYAPPRDHEARGVRALLRCVERYRYDRTESTMGGDGKWTTHTVTHTDTRELCRIELALAGPGRFMLGQPITWKAPFEVPGLGPASFEGDALRCDWTLKVSVDVPLAVDEGIEVAVHVAQPMALLRAGVLDTGAYGLFDEAPVNVDAHPAQVRLEPVPVSLQSPFSGIFTVEIAEPIAIQEVRLELRVRSEVTVHGGHHDEIVAWRGRLADAPPPFGGPLAVHSFQADAPGTWLPTVDLPHGRSRAQFHVILARSMEPDIHYVRDVALATTADL